MTPKYLRKLADITDPNEMWRRLPQLPGCKKMTKTEQHQCDTGVALRRYSDDEATFLRALAEGKSVLITPISTNARAVKLVATPKSHQRLRRNV